jgi:hypothetical protein
LEATEFKKISQELERNGYPFEAFIFVLLDKENKPSYDRKEAKAAYHIHMFAKIKQDKYFVIDTLLPKSSNWREGNQINLADMPVEEWKDAVSGMDERTKLAVERLALLLKVYRAVFK